MKAIIYEGVRKVVSGSWKDPVITQDKDVVVRVSCVGICGSDIHGLNQDNGNYPRIPCHEFVGVVEKTGSGVTKVKQGDRVVVEPLKACGTCYACRHGRYNVCRQVICAGIRPVFPGGAAELFLTTEEKLLPVPEELTDHEAVLTEPYTIGVQVNSRARTQKDDVMLVHGGGPIGLIVMDVAKSMGAKVIVSEIREGRLKMAKRFGADHVINPQERNYQEQVRELTGGMGPNIIVDAVGVPSMLEEAIDLVSPAGAIVSMNFSNVQIPLSYMRMIRKEITLTGSRMQNDKFPVVLNEYKDRLKAAAKILITDVFPMKQATEAFELALSGKDTVGKIVIDFK